jgi:hypothetical protein
MARKKSISELYRRGIPLADAAFHFAPERLVRSHKWASLRWKAKGAAGDLQRIAALRSPSAHESTKASIASHMNIDLQSPPNDPFCERMPDKYLRAFRSQKPRPDYYVQLIEENLIMAFRDLKYIVVGIELPRSSKSKPTCVPDDVFQSSFSVGWKDSVLVGSGLEFVAVRVVPVEPASSETPRGRTSREPEILRAYRELRESGKIKLGDNPKVVTRAIHAAVVKSPAEDWGMHHATIWRHIKSQHRKRTK